MKLFCYMSIAGNTEAEESMVSKDRKNLSRERNYIAWTDASWKNDFFRKVNQDDYHLLK